MGFKYKNILGVLLLVLTIASCDSKDMQVGDPGRSLDYVPADTMLFGGGLEPWKLDELSVLIKSFNVYDRVDWEQTYNKERFNGSPAVRMIIGLYVEYFSALNDTDSLFKNFGVADELDISVYTVGFAPVLRFRTHDEETFEKLIQKIEQERSATSTTEKIGDTIVRRYPVDTPSDDKIDFIIAQQNGFAIFTVDPKTKNNGLRSILGIDRPSSSLADTTKLKTIVDEYKFVPAYLGFIDHVQLVKELTDRGALDFNKVLDGMSNSKGRRPGLGFLEGKTCKAELESIVDLWPKTVIGYTRFDSKSKPVVIDGLAIIESTDKETLAELQKLRGVIPGFGSGHDPILEFAFGLNVEALSPFIGDSIQKLNAKQYQCEFLAGMSQLTSSANPGALGMISLFASGVKGIAVSILELDFETAGGMANFSVKDLQGLVILTTENPLPLFNTATSMLPMLQGMSAPTGGTTMELPIPMLSTVPKLTIKDKYIVLYSGDKAKALADSLNAKTLAPNGVLTWKMDYGAYFDLLLKGMDLGDVADALDKDELKVLESLRDLDASLSTEVDVTDQGIIMKMGMEVR